MTSLWNSSISGRNIVHTELGFNFLSSLVVINRTTIVEGLEPLHSVCLSFCPSVSVHPSLWLSVCRSVHPSLWLSVCRSVHPSLWLSVRVYPSISVAVCPCLSVLCLSICLCVYHTCGQRFKRALGCKNLSSVPRTLCLYVINIKSSQELFYR